MNSLRKEFEFIQKTFFPRLRGWKIRSYLKDYPSSCCLPEKKLINLCPVPENQIQRYDLMIHELAHSSTMGHGKKFQRRLLKAAQEAKERGMERLAKEIEKGVALLVALLQKVDEYYTWKQEVCCTMENWAMDTAEQKISFLKLTKEIARNYGLKLSELRKDKRIYLKLRETFNEARAFAKIDKENREKFEVLKRKEG